MNLELTDPNEIDTIVSNQTHFDWTPDHESILVEWADKAMCYRWLHSKAHVMYSSLNAWYTIPVIIISTVTGTANFAQGRVPLQYQAIFIMMTGGLNILAGIITTIQQFLKISQLNEAHRVSGISWDKFYRNIKIELSKHPDERIEPKQMLKMSKEAFDHLMETSPSIPINIIREFKKRFTKLALFDKIIKPEICDILIPTSQCRNQWYSDENRMTSLDESLKNQQVQQNKTAKKNKQNHKLVTEFIRQFVNLNNRNPIKSEIYDNLKDKLNMNIIDSIFDETTSLSDIHIDDSISDTSLV